MIDTHSHIYLDAFDNDRPEIIKRAHDKGITDILMPNVDVESINRMLETEKSFRHLCHAMMGLHPTSVKIDYKEQLNIIEEWLQKRPFAGIGEIGIDLYWDKSFVSEQKDALSVQLKWAMELNMPVAIHTRDAFNEIFSVLENIYDDRLKGVFHSFSGNQSDAKRILEMPGFFIGINGVITFKNTNLPAIIEKTGIEKLLLETDAPYLAPVPYRGKRNEPAYMAYTRDKIAEILKMTPFEVEGATIKNARDLFRI